MPSVLAAADTAFQTSASILWNTQDRGNGEARPQLRVVCNDRVSKGWRIGICKSLKSEAKIFRSRSVRNHVFCYASRQLLPGKIAKVGVHSSGGERGRWVFHRRLRKSLQVIAQPEIERQAGA